MNIQHIFLLFSVFFTSTVYAEVMITPTRVLLENGQRSSELIIVNKGDEEAAFRLSIENRRMTVDGSLELAETAHEGEKFVKDFVRFSPRRVILRPGQRQTVRVSVDTSDLPPGEYRSHLRVLSAPTSAGRQLQSMTASPTDDISIQLVAIRSLTIPVIARVGKLDAQVMLAAAELKENARLEIDMQRSGSSSAYGNFYIYTEGEQDPVFYARGIALYTPNEQRVVKLPLPASVNQQLSGQKARIVYRYKNTSDVEVSTELNTVL